MSKHVNVVSELRHPQLTPASVMMVLHCVRDVGLARSRIIDAYGLLEAHCFALKPLPASICLNAIPFHVGHCGAVSGSQQLLRRDGHGRSHADSRPAPFLQACVVVQGRRQGMPDDETDLEGWLASSHFLLVMKLS